MKRRIVMALMVGLGWLAATGVARAATYTVYGCDSGHGDFARNWVPFNDSDNYQLKTFKACPTASGLHGLRQRTGDNTRVGLRNGWAAGYRFTAPPGTSIVGFTRQIDEAYAGAGFRALIKTNQATLAGCQSIYCTIFNEKPTGALIPHAAWIESVVECVSASGCTTDDNGYSPDAVMYLGLANVALEDNAPPTITSPRGGLWTSGWVRGPQTLGFDLSDASGISGEAVNVDGRGIDSHPETCDYTNAVPCPQGASYGTTINTRGLSDGTHTLDLAGNDATQSLSNIALVRGTIHTDNNPPAAATNLSVNGGEGWKAANRFDVSWTNPNESGVAPVVAARYRICDYVGSNCGPEQRAAGANISLLTGLSVPAAGDYTLSLWLEDAAGNEDAASAHESVHLRFDPAEPGRAAIAGPAGWVNDVGAAAHPLALGRDPATPSGPSGVAGYAVTFDDSDPGTKATVGGATPAVPITALPQGVTTVKARAISGSGVPSSQITSALVRIDRTRPAVSDGAAPNPAVWNQGQVQLDLSGADQAGLSGMAPAPDSAAADAGGQIVYAVDDGPEHAVRGSAASVIVGADGVHSVAFHAVDAAGNESPVRTAEFKVDGTPPGPVSFAPQDPDDPQALNVPVSDRTSGIAGGSIELRKLGHRSWSALRSAYDGRELHARLNDQRLPPGEYSLRARVRDVAGNTTTSSTGPAGGLERLRLPLRLATRLSVAGRARTALVCRTVRSIRKVRIHGRRTRRRVRVRRCRRLLVPTRAFRDMLVGYGRSLRVYGRLSTDDGQGAAGERIVVRANRRAGRAGRPARLLTDRFGRFSYRVPPGPSRRISFRFGGSAILLAARATESIRVPAVTSLVLSSGRLRVGQTLRFSGRLPAPIPRHGVLVQVQAIVRGRWQTFATPRTNTLGEWAADYTFRATSGVVTYAFRALISRAADYPYETGVSRVRHATVRG